VPARRHAPRGHRAPPVIGVVRPIQVPATIQQPRLPRPDISPPAAVARAIRQSSTAVLVLGAAAALVALLLLPGVLVRALGPRRRP
jgi:hypothetical protein